MEQTLTTESFTQWARDAEPRVRGALTASFGLDIGQEAAAEALAIAWQRWDTIQHKDNIVGYVFGIGRNSARRMTRRRVPDLPLFPEALVPDVEPGLPAALSCLTQQQRAAVALVHGYGWSLSEAAEILGVAKTTVQNHVERGLTRLRQELGVEP